MFLCIGVLYDRMHSRQIADYGGVVKHHAQVRRLLHALRDGQRRPAGHLRLHQASSWWSLGAIQYNFWVAFAAATTLITGAAYTLWMYKRWYSAMWRTTMSQSSKTSGPRVRVPRCARDLRAGHGPLSEAHHRRAPPLLTNRCVTWQTEQAVGERQVNYGMV